MKTKDKKRRERPFLYFYYLQQLVPSDDVGRGDGVRPVGRGPVRPIVSDLDDVLHLRQLVPDALHLVQLLLVVHHEDVGPAVLGHVARGVGRVGRVDAATEVKKIK